MMSLGLIRCLNTSIAEIVRLTPFGVGMNDGVRQIGKFQRRT